ncbi:MAG: hypothetical protein C5B43_02365 [Verrucomicrobia bacterium]|nr:MAG: hypothetical protein C5B43_02365 [Verrucomicrobiota bacterium]
MNSQTSGTIRVALFFIFGAVLLWIVYDTFTSPKARRDNTYPLRAPFEDVKQLKIGSDVRLSGVSIGSVANLRLEGAQAVAILSIDNKNELPVDSMAVITTAGLLGNNYISIHPGILKQYLSENDTIRTKEGADMHKIVEQLGAIGQKVSLLLDDFTGKDKGSLFSNMNGIIDDVRPKINVILDNLNHTTTQVASGKGTFGKFIYGDKVHEELMAAVMGIKQAAADAEKFFKEAGGVINKLNQENGGGPLAFLLHDKKAAVDLKESIANVNDLTRRLNNEKSTLGKLINTDELHAKAENILNRVHNAVEGIENSGPMTAVGISAGALF